MKKLIILLLITLFATYGCTRVPNSVETEVEPGKYNGQLDSSEIIKKNENLSAELEKNVKDLEKLKEENENLRQNNDEIIKELEETKSLLNLLQNEELPKFTSDKTDKESILNYLNEIKAVLTDRSRDIEIIEQKSNESIILFVMVGYNNDYNQLFVWEIGKSEPSIIEGAYYYKDGDYKWLLNDKYLIINSKDNQNIIVNTEDLKVINSFEAIYDDIYLIPDTSSIIIKKNETDYKLIIFDFVNNEEKEIVFDFQNNNLEFEVKNGEIKFSGHYRDNYDVEYSVQAIISIDKLKEKYEIKSLSKSLKGNEDEETVIKEENTEDTV